MVVSTQPFNIWNPLRLTASTFVCSYFIHSFVHSVHCFLSLHFNFEIPQLQQPCITTIFDSFHPFQTRSAFKPPSPRIVRETLLVWRTSLVRLSWPNKFFCFVSEEKNNKSCSVVEFLVFEATDLDKFLSKKLKCFVTKFFFHALLAVHKLAFA